MGAREYPSNDRLGPPTTSDAPRVERRECPYSYKRVVSKSGCGAGTSGRTR